MIVIEKIQFYIPSLLEFQNKHSRRTEEEIKVVGIKKKYIKYFSGYHDKEMTHIDQIVAEDFTIYDLQFDSNTKLLSFYLEYEREFNQSKVLEKVFQTFIVEYNPHSFGFFTIAKGKRRPRTLVK